MLNAHVNPPYVPVIFEPSTVAVMLMRHWSAGFEGLSVSDTDSRFTVPPSGPPAFTSSTVHAQVPEISLPVLWENVSRSWEF